MTEVRFHHVRELRNILELYDRGQAAALVTLVRVEGSSYRRPGARLLIAKNGEYAGGISGGCLEAEVIRKTQWKVGHGPVIDRYSTLFDDTAEIPYGLGCGGTVDLLLEPADTPEFAALMEAIRATLHGDARQVTTQLPEDGAPFLRCILNAAGEPVFRSSLRPVDPAQPTFLETLTPPQRLLIFGAGDDAQPMVRTAALLGWNVVVLDGRPQWARPERFPEAERVLTLNPTWKATGNPALNALGNPALKGTGFSPYVNPSPKAGALAPEGIADLTITSSDAVILMTHSYEQDRAFLTAVLPQHPRYLGLLGARHRSALLVAEAAAMLGWPLAAACEGIFSPIGLDLGGDGAEVIALATIAEIQASLENKLDSPRRITPEIIASQLTEGNSSRYLQTQCAL